MEDRDADFEERAAIVQHDGCIPKPFADAFAALDPTRPPADYPPGYWLALVDGIGMFLDEWADRALALGWGPLELFGVHPGKPYARLDVSGLAGLLVDRRVAAMTDQTATLRTAGGATQTFRRSGVSPGGVFLWNLV